MTLQQGRRLRIAFCVFGVTEDTIRRNEFYWQDYEALCELGHEVTIVLSPLELIRRRFDVAFVWWWNYAWLWGAIAILRRIPVVATGVFNDRYFDAWPAWKRFLKRLGTRVPKINILVSELEMRTTPSRARFRRDSIRYSPCVVDTELYVPPATRPAEETFTILSVSWQDLLNLKRKKVFDLVDAFAKVHREFPHTRLVLAGAPGSGSAQLRERIEASGVAEAIQDLGEIPRDAKIRLMQQASVYCQASEFEGFGLAVAEAMACGTPVLVSRAGELPTVVGDCGVYVPDLSEDAIADGLRWCVRNAGELGALGARGRARVETLFPKRRRREDFARFLAEVVK